MATNNVKLTYDIGSMTPEQIKNLKNQRMNDRAATEKEIGNLNVYATAAEDAERAKIIFDIYVNAGFTKAQAASILSGVMRDYVEMTRRMM